MHKSILHISSRYTSRTPFSTLVQPIKPLCTQLNSCAFNLNLVHIVMNIIHHAQGHSLHLIKIHLKDSLQYPCATNQTLVHPAEVLCIQLKPCAYSNVYHTPCTREFSTSHQETPQGLPLVHSTLVCKTPF